LKKNESPWILSERKGWWILNLFPPLLFNRIRVVKIEPGFRACTVRVARSLLTRNLHGTTFGGTIFSAADPYYAVMYWQVLARRGYRVQAWLKRAGIDYHRPAETALTLEFRLSDDEIAEAVAALDGAGRHRKRHVIEALDREGRVCATVETEVYLRLPGATQKEVSAF
jgi:acyl-coenzyme A thioesterase PaaI-like protein